MSELQNGIAKTAFRTVGAVTIALAVFVLWEAAFSARLLWARESVANLTAGIVVVLTLAVLGIGLVVLRKWAAVGVSLLALYPALICAFARPRSISAHANWIGYFLALLFGIPSLLTILCWRALR